MEITADWKAKFDAKWLKDENECWVWQGAKVPKGYGMIGIPRARRYIYAHRLSYLIHVGEIPEGMNVLHRCDVPACVNPAHLFTGSLHDNSQDMVAKDRHLYGERNGNAVLTAPDVVRIKKLLATGLMAQHEIGSMFGVSQITISRIHTGLRWKHITI